MVDSAYQNLESRFRRLILLQEAEGVLHWDMATMMPPGGAAARAEQLAEMRAVQHGVITDPAIGDLLDAADAETGLDAWQAANLHEMRRRWTHATALDEDLVTALSRAVSACETVWREARADADFKRILPNLETVLGLTRQVAQAKAERLGLSPYDALLDQYEPDGRSAEIDVLFADLEAFLPGFLAEVLDHQASLPAVVRPAGPFPTDRQKALARRLIEVIGFDFRHGRLDESLHPFSGGTPEDLRITTRYDEADFMGSLMGVLHETGHALYDRHLPAAWRHQPVGDARGMSIHESQSLLMEMQVCRSRPFLEFAAPLIREAFDGDERTWAVDNLFRLYTRVEPGFIRVDADEVTYPAHVILRYRLERAMIEGDLAAADLPGAWNDAMRDLLGLTPPDDRLGCLQDIHWYDGAWGYFPTYTLGAMTAAQLFDTARRDATVVDGIGRGDFKPLLAWLGANVHGKASSISARDLVIQATGRPLETAVFKRHLAERYLS